MKVTQKNVRVFHIIIDDEEAFLDYFRKNSILLKEFFLLIEGNITKSIAFVLDQNGICYKDISTCSIRLGVIKTQAPLIEEERKEEKAIENVVAVVPSIKSKLYDRPIRSGEEISEHVPTVIFGRVNSGAKVFCEESLSVYGVIDGLVQCDGEYVIVNGISPRGNLIFNGEIIDKDRVKQGVLQKIVSRDGVIEIKDVV
ncbi:MAG: septum site-determining protein MinC [Campylobacteraceae bacterium]|nr:septum site-determining protein MinC [Campylobacteraceae bacterium]